MLAVSAVSNGLQSDADALASEPQRARGEETSPAHRLPTVLIFVSCRDFGDFTHAGEHLQTSGAREASGFPAARALASHNLSEPQRGFGVEMHAVRQRQRAVARELRQSPPTTPPPSRPAFF